MLPGVLVRLVDGGDAGEALIFGLFLGHFEGGGDFFGMVGVVRIETRGEAFKPAADAWELVEGLENRCSRRRGAHFVDGAGGQSGILAT